MKLDRAGNARRVCAEFFRRAERIAIAVDEQGRNAEVTEVIDSQSIRFLRWVKRVAQQHDCSGGKSLGDRHRTDATPHRTASEGERTRMAIELSRKAGCFFDKRGDQLRCPVWRLAAFGPIRKLHAAHREIELLVERDQQTVICAPTGAVGEQQTGGQGHDAKRIRRASVMSAIR